MPTALSVSISSRRLPTRCLPTRCRGGLLVAAAICVVVGCNQQGSVDTAENATDQQAAPAVNSTESVEETIIEQSEAVVSIEEQNPSVDSDKTASDDKVLRHAVFFSFQEESTPEDIQGVVDAFAALPEQISEIIDFEHGTNNSTEGFDDGFTHCFLLTFQDEAGRATYLPHPAHTGKFADTLRPHMKDVFVVDYWGTTGEQKPQKELKHAVFLKFKDSASPEEIRNIENEFALLATKIDSIKGFEWGLNNSPETHDDGFTHCFMVTFDSEEGREAYLPHPDHQAFVKVLMPVLDKVRVLDYWAS